METDIQIRVIKDAPTCKVCNNDKGNLTIHFPTYKFVSGTFHAPEWYSHEKYYCRQCGLLWATYFDDLDHKAYGQKYREANYDEHRRPTEDRMIAAPKLLRLIVEKAGDGRFLDYGVGYNSPYIYELRGRDIDLWGCDISTGINYSRYVKRIPVDDLPQGSFHGLYSLDVAEHLIDIIGEYQRQKDLLCDGGLILHSTYWLHEMWRTEDLFPALPALINPWHISICSDITMSYIANRVGLEYLGAIKLPTDTGCGYLLRKPGRLPSNILNRLIALSRIDKHLKYVEKAYRP